jgi:alkylation response protein AidB-like acyl-CoA dehydrogenase
MAKLCHTEGLTVVQEEILKTVRAFVDSEILPVASELEHADQCPTEIVEGMRELGLFGLTIPKEYGSLGEFFAHVCARGRGAGSWMDERLPHRQHAPHRRVPAHAAWHGRATA